MNNWSKEDILKLTLVKQVGTARALKIIDNYKNFDDFRHNSTDYNKYINKDNLFSFDDLQQKYDYQLELLEKNKDYNIVTYWDDNYPTLLKEITDPPLILYTWGKLKKIENNAVALVGTRKNSLYGKLVTEQLTQYLSLNNISVVSGLASGIDTLAHLNTIKNNGHTIAVIASGLDKLSPSLTVTHAHKIIESGGSIISNFEFGKPAIPPYFLLRNRIISGISKSVVIIESAIKGGSLWTARFGNDQNREIFAVPGNINSDKSKGTNKLIKDNLANMLIDFEDILISLGMNPKNIFKLEEKVIEFKKEEWKQIYNNLSFEPLHIDTLANEIEFEMPTLLFNLLEMEFEGIIRQLPGKYYIKN